MDLETQLVGLTLKGSPARLYTPRLLIVGDPWLGTKSSAQSSWQPVHVGCLGVPVCLCGDQLLLAALTCP